MLASAKTSIRFVLALSAMVLVFYGIGVASEDSPTTCSPESSDVTDTDCDGQTSQPGDANNTPGSDFPSFDEDVLVCNDDTDCDGVTGIGGSASQPELEIVNSGRAIPEVYYDGVLVTPGPDQPVVPDTPTGSTDTLVNGSDEDVLVCNDDTDCDGTVNDTNNPPEVTIIDNGRDTPDIYIDGEPGNPPGPPLPPVEEPDNSDDPCYNGRC